MLFTRQTHLGRPCLHARIVFLLGGCPCTWAGGLALLALRELGVVDGLRAVPGLGDGAEDELAIVLVGDAEVCELEVGESAEAGGGVVLFVSVGGGECMHGARRTGDDEHLCGDGHCACDGEVAGCEELEEGLERERLVVHRRRSTERESER